MVLRLVILVLTLVAASSALADNVLLAGTGTDNVTIETYLQVLGHTVTRSPSDTLPANLSPYDTVWVHTLALLSASDIAKLEAFVELGGGVYLNGEHPGLVPNPAVNGEQLVNATVTGAASITVGDGSTFLGSSGTPNASAVNGITTTPYSPTYMAFAASGGIAGTASANQVVTGSSIVLVGAWRDADMVGGLGRIVIVMDSNWAGLGDPWTDEWVANIEYFLRGQQADLSAAKTDGLTTAVPGQPVSYTITVANAGPSAVTGATVTDTIPAALLGATWTCSASAGSACTASGAGNINDTVDVPVGGSLTYTLTGSVHPEASGTLVNTATVAVPGGVTDPDPLNDSATDTDTLVPAGLFIEGELNHGSGRWHDLAAPPGPAGDTDLFRILQRPHASYEVLLDGASGDIGSGPLLELVASDGSTVLQSSAPAGVGGSRSLRFMNALDTPVADEYVRVRSAGCTTDCDAQDVYRLSALETTGFITRFNNSGTQITVLVLQNQGDAAMDVDIRFWNGAGAPAGSVPIQTLAPRGTYVLNTLTAAPGSGSISVGNTGRYGQLAGKAVAVEPATGFTFDTALQPRPR